ncbi:hypothetical protein M8C21_022538 [Ambrosia artemisiifolia]|uniref:Cytochrome c oxidase subunit 6b-1-like protein n=1 Tax=Ambrosia artemisiifolia TaxID=4212 RepID=A0AAD5BN52_AMBAR|nr:hypothetical protein M8C21_022538 [Ambrosia artemisiifolia]
MTSLMVNDKKHLNMLKETWQDYLLKELEEKVNVSTEPKDKSADKDAVEVPPTPPVTEEPVETPVTPAVNESVPESVDAATEENAATTENSDNDATEPPPAATEEGSENTDENTVDETPEIKLETAPGDYRFPTTNQSRHCFTRYVEYHRCVAAKGEDASECDKFAKYYRSLCPGEWIDRWNEQRENGTFPGPL